MSSDESQVQITAEQIAQLDRQFHEMRHNVNNSLAAIVSALELLRFKPETTEKMLETAINRTRSVSADMRSFSGEFERILGLRASEKHTE